MECTVITNQSSDLINIHICMREILTYFVAKSIFGQMRKLLEKQMISHCHTKRVFDQNKRYFLIVIELCSDKNWSLELKNFFFSLYITWILTNIEKYWTNLILSIDYLQYNSIFRNLLKSLFVGFFAYLYFSKCS